MKNKKQIKKTKSRGIIASITTLGTFFTIYDFIINIFKKNKKTIKQ